MTSNPTPTEPAPGEVPPGSSTWATDPLSGPLPAPGAAPEGTPADLTSEVRDANPGTWPTSFLDLPEELIEEGNGTGPTEFPPDPGHDHFQPFGEPPPAELPDPLFMVNMQIRPTDDQGTLRFDLVAVGTAARVYGMIEATASAFVENAQRR